jgi:hypothetical protein
MSEDSERLDRLEHHFRLYKQDMADIKDSVKEIKILLGGSALNGNKGFVRLMELNEEKIDNMEVEIAKIKNDFETAKFWGRGATGVAFVTLGLIIKKILSL